MFAVERALLLVPANLPIFSLTHDGTVVRRAARTTLQPFDADCEVRVLDAELLPGTAFELGDDPAGAFFFFLSPFPYQHYFLPVEFRAGHEALEDGRGPLV